MPDASELCFENLDFSIKRPSRCIGKSFFKIVDDGFAVVFKGFDDLAETFISKILDIIVLSGKIKPGNSWYSLLVEYVHKVKA